MKQSKNEAETAHISEETNIKKEECGKAQVLTIVGMLGLIADSYLRYDKNFGYFSRPHITIEVSKEQKDKIINDLCRETDGIFGDEYANKPIICAGFRFSIVCPQDAAESIS